MTGRRKPAELEELDHDEHDEHEAYERNLPEAGTTNKETSDMNISHPLSLIARVAFTLLLLAITPVARGQVDAVSNLDEASNVSFNVSDSAFAQSFTTGDTPRILSTVTVDAQSNSTGSSGMILSRDFRSRPGDLVENLGSQSVPGGSSQPVYTSTGTTLEANTTYWLTLGEGGSGSGDYGWSATTSTNQTSTLGWTIADQVLVSVDGGTRWTQHDFGPPNESCRFSIQVEELPDPITFRYSGVVDGMASGGFPDPAPFQAFNGQPINVTFTYDPNTPDNNTSDNGDYLGAVTDLQVTVGGNVYNDIDGGDIIITNNDVNPDQFQVFSFVTGPAVGGITEAIQLRMIFSDSTHTVFSTDALPINQPDPADFNLGGQINLQFTDVNDFDNFGNIITNDVSCDGDCVTTIGSGILVTRTQTVPSIDFGPISFGLTELPDEAKYTVMVQQKSSNGATTYGLEDVINASFVIGDGEFTELVSFSMVLEVDGSLESMSASFVVIDTPSVTDGAVVLNSPAFITGTDTASGLDFAYTFGESSDTIEMNALLGDVNRDGVTDFLDIGPFISVLSGGPFQLEADTNDDGVVDFFDISSFIAILSGT